MKPGRIAIYIIIFYLLDMIYEITFPVSAPRKADWWHVVSRVYYYVIHYGALCIVSWYGLTKTNFKPDSFSLLTLFIYTLGKLIFYLFIINSDMPTYIIWCNSKPVALLTSVLLWGFSCLIWYKTFRIKKLFYDRRY